MLPRSYIAILVVFVHVRGYNEKPNLDFGRLPDDTEPEWYALSVVPNFDAVNPSFSGRVDISILVKTTTAEITFNSKDLVLHEIKITDDNTNGDIRVDSWKCVEDLEQVKVKLDELIFAKRKYTIHIDYSGYLNDGASKIFHTSYNDYLRIKKWVAANNQLQTTRARSAFPCYDESHFKTSFNVSIKTKRNEIALSSMPILNTVYIDESSEKDSTDCTYKTWVYFIQTPLISTSMVNIFVGELKQLGKLRQGLSYKDDLNQKKYIMRRALNQPNAKRNKIYANIPTDSSSISSSTNEVTQEPTSTYITTDSTSMSSITYEVTQEPTSTHITTDSTSMSSSTYEVTQEPTSTHITTDSSSMSSSTYEVTQELTSTHITTDSTSMSSSTYAVTQKPTSTHITTDSTSMSSSTYKVTEEPTSTSVSTDSSSIYNNTKTEEIQSSFYTDSTTTLNTPVEPESITYNKTSTEHVPTSELFVPSTKYTSSTYKPTTIIASTKPFYERPYFVFNFIFTSMLIIIALLMGTVFFWKKMDRKNI